MNTIIDLGAIVASQRAAVIARENELIRSQRDRGELPGRRAAAERRAGEQARRAEEPSRRRRVATA